MMPVFIYSSIKTAQSGAPGLAGGDVRDTVHNQILELMTKHLKYTCIIFGGKKAFYTFGKLS